MPMIGTMERKAARICSGRWCLTEVTKPAMPIPQIAIRPKKIPTPTMQAIKIKKRRANRPPPVPINWTGCPPTSTASNPTPEVAVNPGEWDKEQEHAQTAEYSGQEKHHGKFERGGAASYRL